MSDMTQRTREELRLMSLMLGKLLGGLLAVGGFAVAVLAVTWRPPPTTGLLPPLFCGAVGVGIFLLASRGLERRLAARTVTVAVAEGKRGSDRLAWGLLAGFVVLFLAVSYFLTR